MVLQGACYHVTPLLFQRPFKCYTLGFVALWAGRYGGNQISLYFGPNTSISILRFYWCCLSILTQWYFCWIIRGNVHIITALPSHTLDACRDIWAIFFSLRVLCPLSQIKGSLLPNYNNRRGKHIMHASAIFPPTVWILSVITRQGRCRIYKVKDCDQPCPSFAIMQWKSVLFWKPTLTYLFSSSSISTKQNLTQIEWTYTAGYMATNNTV